MSAIDSHEKEFFLKKNLGFYYQTWPTQTKTVWADSVEAKYLCNTYVISVLTASFY